MTATLYEFVASMSAFQVHLEANEEDEACLRSLAYFKPSLVRCKDALDTIKEFMERSNFIGKYLV